MLLKEIFVDLVSKFTADKNLEDKLWTEIEEHYTAKNRHYHTLVHLDSLLGQLTEIKEELLNWDGILFTLYYHDIIYNPQKSDNEEKSSELAVTRLTQLSVPEELIKNCKEQILATKSHTQSNFSDTNYFTDADLSILGQPWETYSNYSKNVCKLPQIGLLKSRIFN